MRSVVVYIYLPGSSTPVAAGRMTSVADEIRRQALFVYFPDYLARPDAVSIDPINLALDRKKPEKIFETDPETLMTVFGAVRDACPDAWGQARMAKGSTHKLDVFDYVLASGEDRFGNLAFGPDESGPRIIAPWAASEFKPDRLLDFEILRDVLADFESYEIPDEIARDLLNYGTTLGGARPKATVVLDGRIWLAKAPRKDDQTNVPRGEYAALTFAREIGLNVPECRLVNANGRDVFLIERFDREFSHGKILRRGALSALTTMSIPDNIMEMRQSATYPLLAEKLKSLNSPNDDLLELWKRIIYNIFVANMDDHARNHAILHRNGSWRLSPLYDVEPLPNCHSTRNLVMKFGPWAGEGTVQNVLASAEFFGLSPGDAKSELTRLMSQVRGASDHFRKIVPTSDLKGYEATFDHFHNSWEAEVDVDRPATLPAKVSVRV